MSATVLERILLSTRAELQRRKRELPLQRLRERVASTEAPAGRFHAALTRPGMAVIAEFKRRSPSAGELRPGAEIGDVVAAYERGGAGAVSVLTEGPHFQGELADLRAARAACTLPLLRKDFVVDVYQLYEARIAGAEAVLLIVAALTQSQLTELHAAAGELGLAALVEVHDRAELERALAVAPELIGVNNRDLRDFSVDVRRTFELLGEIPPGVAVVSESGIARAEQLRELGAAGVQAVLVGESLMRAPDPARALAALRGAESAAVGDAAAGARVFNGGGARL